MEQILSTESFFYDALEPFIDAITMEIAPTTIRPTWPASTPPSWISCDTGGVQPL
jgi:hypothetical protein